MQADRLKLDLLDRLLVLENAAAHLVNVRFAPKATEVLRCRELTRCAASDH
jgi:hypothetical protein